MLKGKSRSVTKNLESAPGNNGSRAIPGRFRELFERAMSTNQAIQGLRPTLAIGVPCAETTADLQQRHMGILFRLKIESDALGLSIACGHRNPNGNEV